MTTQIPSRRFALRDSRCGLAVLLLIGSTLAANMAGAQLVVSASSDVTIALGSNAEVAADQDVAIESGAGFAILEDVGGLPDSADLVGYGQTLTGERLIVLDTTASLPGGLVAGRGDVVLFDGVSFSPVFDASSEGVPSGAITDAVSLAPNGLLLSFDTTVDLLGVIAADEDLVRWNGVGYSLVFDGSAQGIDRALDIDGAQDLGGGAFLMSFDTSGEVGGVVFADEDVLRFDSAGWSLAYDASVFDPDWRAADLDAVFVPEPSGALRIGGGLLAFVAARSRRLRSRI